MNAQGDRWYGDRAAWSLIGRRYLPWLVILNLVWEVAQLPLYSLWTEASPAYLAFAVVHCTAGDAVTGIAALVVALMATRAQSLAAWRWDRIAVATVLAGAGYTMFSEWMNTAVSERWAYSGLMPVLRAAGVEFGLAPLAQWLLLPLLVLRIVRPRD